MVVAMSVQPRDTAPQRRRNQAERSAATREALLDATLECLVEDGYANTTTARVAERAGVSRGAHLHHFQTRATLVAAAADHLTHRRGEHLMKAVDALPTGPTRIGQGLDLIWNSYNNPLYQATLDLWTNARTDPELREHLVPIERRLDRQTMELSRRLFPDAAERPDFERVVELALATIRGLVVLDTLHTGSARASKQWERCRPQLVALFENGS
jgi:AcrR family transcriptional regulator